MKVLLEIKDAKAPFVLELLKNLPFVKAKNLTSYKAKVLEDVRDAVEEMNLVKSGKLIARDAEELFGEL